MRGLSPATGSLLIDAPGRLEPAVLHQQQAWLSCSGWLTRRSGRSTSVVPICSVTPEPLRNGSHALSARIGHTALDALGLRADLSLDGSDQAVDT